MWIKKDFPIIPGYESSGDNVAAKRFLDFKLNKLLETDDDFVKYVTSKIPGSGVNIKSREDACNFVVLAFDYPMVRGIATDVHRSNWFSGLSCHQLTLDYFQTAGETLRTLRLNERQGKKGYGDCEDCAALLVTLFLMKKWQAWDCLGVVYQDAQMLGGHSWGLLQDENGAWRLMEATLSTPPKYPHGYPVADPEANDWHFKGLTYHAMAKFARKEYYEEELIAKYLSFRFKNKEARAKHEAISRAWGIKTKPLAKLSLMSKLRWR